MGDGYGYDATAIRSRSTPFDAFDDCSTVIRRRIAVESCLPLKSKSHCTVNNFCFDWKGFSTSYGVPWWTAPCNGAKPSPKEHVQRRWFPL